MLRRHQIVYIIASLKGEIDRLMANEGLGIEITELRLGLPGGGVLLGKSGEKKRSFSVISDESNSSVNCGESEPSKTQVVGWPPVSSFRRKCNEKSGEMYVKVSMDGAPYLRKIDLSVLSNYSDLYNSLGKLFGCFGIENKDYVPIYEDKDGDWMLVGDVPWEMFIESCKRLRVMKKCDAKGFGVQFDRLVGEIIQC